VQKVLLYLSYYFILYRKLYFETTVHIFLYWPSGEISDST
jgi:hypothetical protein